MGGIHLHVRSSYIVCSVVTTIPQQRVIRYVPVVQQESVIVCYSVTVLRDMQYKAAIFLSDPSESAEEMEAVLSLSALFRWMFIIREWKCFWAPTELF